MRTEHNSPSVGRLAVLFVVLLSAAACRQDMHDQAKLEPLEASTFFANGMASRQPPEFTVARGHLERGTVFFVGKDEGGSWSETLPMELTAEVLAKGQERFGIYCTPCHDWTGSGRGMIVQRGFKQPPSYHEPRLRAMPVGYFFNVATNGFGLMSGYRAQTTPEERWAIASWVRVLQRSQHSPFDSLPAGDREALTAIPDIAEVPGDLDRETVRTAPAAGEHAGAGLL